MIPPNILVIINLIFVIYLCFYSIQIGKLYTNVSNILNKMVKKLESKQKKPNNFDEFLKNYSIEKEEIKTKINKLITGFDDIKKHNYWIPIGIAIVMLCFTGVNSWLYYTEVTQESLISDITGIEILEKIGNDELYQIKLHNYGSTEQNLQITISFYLEVELLDVFNIDEEARRIKEELRTDKSEYYVQYSQIYANEDIIIRLEITSDELEQNESSLIYPYSINAFTNEGKIIVTRG